MTRYWVPKEFLGKWGKFIDDIPQDEEVIKSADLPAHDAALRAQVWEEAAKVAQDGAEALRHVGKYEKAEALFGLAAALRHGKKCPAWTPTL